MKNIIFVLRDASLFSYSDSIISEARNSNSKITLCIMRENTSGSTKYSLEESHGKKHLVAENLSSSEKEILISENSNLKKKIVGILGLAFKAETDDIRDSLAIKLVKLLKSKKIKTLQSDEFYKSKDNINKKKLIRKSDIIILSAPHKTYKKLKIEKNKTLIDVWGLIDKG